MKTYLKDAVSYTAIRTGPVRGQNRNFLVKFAHTGKNLFSLQGFPQRENPVFITGKGLQCTAATDSNR